MKDCVGSLFILIKYTIDMNYYGLAGKMIAQYGKREELLKILLKASELLNKNDECKLYIVSKVNDDENAIWVNEAWTSKEAHDNSLEPEDIRKLVMSALPILAEKPEIGLELDTVGSKGL